MDKTELGAKIDEALELNEEDYTEESWANLVAALQDALAVYEDEEATQEEVDAALAALIAAIEALVPAEEEPGEVDKTALGAKIDEALELNEEDYTEESWANLVAALQDALAVYEDENATQEEVDAALAALIAAIEALVPAEEEPVPEPEIEVTIKIALQIGDIVPFVQVDTMIVRNLPGARLYQIDYLLAGNVPATTKMADIETGLPAPSHGHPMFRYTEYVTIRIYDANENLLHTFEDVHLVLPE